MTNHSILEELHQIREKLLAEAGGTLEGLVARLQKEQRASGRVVRKTTTNQVLHGSSDGQSTSRNQSTPGTP